MMASITAPPILNTFRRNWTVTPVDGNGNPIAVTPTWTLTSDPAIGIMVIAPDSQSAFATPAAGASGNITFTVSANGVTDDGIQPVEAAPTLAALNLSFQDPIPQ